MVAPDAFVRHIHADFTFAGCLHDRSVHIDGCLCEEFVRLLQMKTLAIADPDRPARKVIPLLWLQILKAVGGKLQRVHDLTIYEFYREVAKLGGFLGRKSDDEPGWITVWRGWEKLNNLVRGARIALDLQPNTCG
jgi:hypothetical protein